MPCFRDLIVKGVLKRSQFEGCSGGVVNPSDDDQPLDGDE
jgi:hypothetical protein